MGLPSRIIEASEGLVFTMIAPPVESVFSLENVGAMSSEGNFIPADESGLGSFSVRAARASSAIESWEKVVFFETDSSEESGGGAAQFYIMFRRIV
jgi:hypothetical protein